MCCQVTCRANGKLAVTNAGHAHVVVRRAVRWRYVEFNADQFCHDESAGSMKGVDAL